MAFRPKKIVGAKKCPACKNGTLSEKRRKAVVITVTDRAKFTARMRAVNERARAKKAAADA